MPHLLHISDLHFGPHYLPDVGNALVEQARQWQPDLIIASGDFTQRAKRHEFQLARQFLDRLPKVPCVVIPGNHDVPLYRFWERLLLPYGQYGTHLTAQLDQVHQIEGAFVVALNSSAPRSAIVNGWLDDRQLDFASQAFERAPADAIRVVVAHHPFAQAPDDRHDPLIRQAERAIRRFAALGVELILGGHLHRSFIDTAARVFPQAAGDANILIVQSGTTTSNRGRQAERGINSLNRLQVSGASIEVTNYRFATDQQLFLPAREETHARGPGHQR